MLHGLSAICELVGQTKNLIYNVVMLKMNSMAVQKRPLLELKDNSHLALQIETVH